MLKCPERFRSMSWSNLNSINIFLYSSNSSNVTIIIVSKLLPKICQFSSDDNLNSFIVLSFGLKQLTKQIFQVCPVVPKSPSTGIDLIWSLQQRFQMMQNIPVRAPPPPLPCTQRKIWFIRILHLAPDSTERINLNRVTYIDSVWYEELRQFSRQV